MISIYMSSRFYRNFEVNDPEFQKISYIVSINYIIHLHIVFNGLNSIYSIELL